MTKLELRIWRAFLAEAEQPPPSWREEVGVGTPPEIPPGYEDIAMEKAAWLWQKKIDAVGFFPDRQVIYEVKPRLTMTSLGQLIVYRELYLREFRPDQPVEVAVVTPVNDPDLFPIFFANGVGVFIVKGVL